MYIRNPDIDMCYVILFLQSTLFLLLHVYQSPSYMLYIAFNNTDNF